MKTGALKHGDVTVFDPSYEHHYQPSYTMVGGGVLGDAAYTKRVEEEYIVRTNQEMFNKNPGVNWV